MSKYTEEQDDVQFSEPIVAQKNVRLKVDFAEKAVWKNKVDGKGYDACKLTLRIDDDSVRTEHSDAKPKLMIEDQFNIESYPYLDKKTGATKKMGKNKLYQLEGALEFDPVFVAGGEKVEPFITRTGNKVAPKIKGVKRLVNPDFFEAYFNQDGSPKPDSWIDIVLYADVKVETSEQFASKNVIERYVKKPSI